ncbi:ribonuclease Z [Candidatus Woesearchaeota archaeon]|nr:ribonuclease Z [Candidatus Woesearchaeota archaeon]
MKITFLGTSCAVPTKERNPTSFFLEYRGEGILFECGEGTQRQLKIAGIKPTRVTRILISHWHGDHVLGLAGLIDTLGFLNYNKTLHIYGPRETKKRLASLLESTVDELRIALDVKEIGEGRFYDGRWFELESSKLEHKHPTLGYAFIEKYRRRIDVKYVKKLGIPMGPLLGKLQEGKQISYKGRKISVKDATYVVKGKKIAYVADTLPCKGAYDIAKDADLLVAESTYISKDKEKAREYYHMTAQDAAQIANKSNAKKLLLVHISARYKNVQEIEQDARDIFDNSFAAKDFMKVDV